jgi:hypothetical protein
MVGETGRKKGNSGRNVGIKKDEIKKGGTR